MVTTQVSGDDLFRLAMADFGVDDGPGTDKATLIRRFENLVRAHRQDGRRCLLVIDDVWDRAHLRPFVRGGKGCTRLITTRSFAIADEAVADEAGRVAVDEMTPG